MRTAREAEVWTTTCWRTTGSGLSFADTNCGHNKIMMAAKLIGPKVGKTPEGYEYLRTRCIARVRLPANELEMEKALGHPKAARRTCRRISRRGNVASASLKKEHSLKAKAATNLFPYYQEGDLENATAYAELSVASNRYDARALVNKGNCLWKGDLPGRDVFATPPTLRRIASRPFTTSDSRTKTWARTPRRSGRFERFTRCFRISTRRYFSSETSRI